MKELSVYPISSTQHAQIEELAYRLWEKRGRPLGSPDDDWFRAEREFNLLSERPPFTSLSMGPIEY